MATYGAPYDPNTQYAAPPTYAPAAAPDPYRQAYAPAPAGYPPAPVQYTQYANPDELRTVFLTGFPNDVKEREVNNLLRFLHEYEASQMHWKNGQAQGFALFRSGNGARAAISALHGLQFEENCLLRCELAHKNMYLKDDPAAKRGRYGNDYQGYNATPSYYAPPAAASHPSPTSGPRSYAPVTNVKDNPPCNTLFIGNLGDNTSDAELRALFTNQPGFQQLKLIRGVKGLTCFIEFADIASAMSVHQTQQGAVLASSDRGGIRIQYSKNPFGKKRDVGGNYVNVGGYQDSYNQSFTPPLEVKPEPVLETNGAPGEPKEEMVTPAETGFTEDIPAATMPAS